MEVIPLSSLWSRPVSIYPLVVFEMTLRGQLRVMGMGVVEVGKCSEDQVLWLPKLDSDSVTGL